MKLLILHFVIGGDTYSEQLMLVNWINCHWIHRYNGTIFSHMVCDPWVFGGIIRGCYSIEWISWSWIKYIIHTFFLWSPGIYLIVSPSCSSVSCIYFFIFPLIYFYFCVFSILCLVSLLTFVYVVVHPFISHSFPFTCCSIPLIYSDLSSASGSFTVKCRCVVGGIGVYLKHTIYIIW